MDIKQVLTQQDFIKEFGEEEYSKQKKAYETSQSKVMTLEQFLFQIQERLRGKQDEN